jgi:hypothetical protein
MPTPKKRINIELHLSLSATFLSLAALIVSIFQTKIAREQQQKSVLPYLQIRHEIADNNLQIILENKGVGPAFIHNVQMLHNQQTAQDYNSFISSELAEGEQKLNRLDNRLPEAVQRQQIAKDPQMQMANDWFEGSKNKEIIEAGTALKEGDQMSIYEWRKKGNVGGPFLNYIEHLIADSTYQIQITYKDVYDNCWQLTHKGNRNGVVQLANCPN